MPSEDDSPALFDRDTIDHQHDLASGCLRHVLYKRGTVVIECVRRPERAEVRMMLRGCRGNDICVPSEL